MVDVLPEELRVEGEDGDLVAANEQEGRKVPRDEVQPGHVEQRRYSRLLRQRQRHQDQGGAIDEDMEFYLLGHPSRASTTAVAQR